VTGRALPFKAALVCKDCFWYMCNDQIYTHSVTGCECCAGVWCPQNTIRADSHARLQQRQHHRWHQNQRHICICRRTVFILDWLCTCMLLCMVVVFNFARCTHQSNLQRYGPKCERSWIMHGAQVITSSWFLQKVPVSTVATKNLFTYRVRVTNVG